MTNKELQDSLLTLVEKLKEFPDDRRVRIYTKSRPDDEFEQLFFYKAVIGKFIMSDDIDISIS